MKKYIIGRYNGENYPLIKISDEGADSTLVSFFNTKHHYSLHPANITNATVKGFVIRQNNESITYSENYTGPVPIFFTSYDKDKQTSVWDKEILDIAGKNVLSIKEPERQKYYYENRVLPLGITPIFKLGGRTLILKKGKCYKKDVCVFQDIKHINPFVEVFYTRKNPARNFDIQLTTLNGILGFSFTKTPVLYGKIKYTTM